MVYMKTVWYTGSLYNYALPSGFFLFCFNCSSLKQLDTCANEDPSHPARLLFITLKFFSIWNHSDFEVYAWYQVIKTCITPVFPDLLKLVSIIYGTHQFWLRTSEIRTNSCCYTSGHKRGYTAQPNTTSAQPVVSSEKHLRAFMVKQHFY